MAHLQVNMRPIIHQELIDGETVDRQCEISLRHHDVLKAMQSTSPISHHSSTYTQSSRVSSKFFLCSLVHHLSRHSLKDVVFSKSGRIPHSFSAEQTTSSSFICSTSDSLLSEFPLVNHFHYFFQIFQNGWTKLWSSRYDFLGCPRSSSGLPYRYYWHDGKLHLADGLK